MYFQTLKLDFDIFSNVHTIKDKYFNFILILVCTDFERECRIIFVFFLFFFYNNLSPKKVTQCLQIFAAFYSLFAYMELLLQ